MTEKLLLTGRAGSGKTRAVLEKLLQALRDGRSEEILLLLPTQSQVDHLRGVLLREGLPAFRDDFAHTFFTLARTLGRGLPEQLLNEEARDYILGEVLRIEPLPSFEGIRETRGFRELLGESIRELKQNAIRPAEYARKVLEALGGVSLSIPKHRDLGRAFQAYHLRLERAGRIDQEDLERAALERLESEPALLAHKRLLLVDGFHDFTLVQTRILSQMAQRARESIFTLSFDALRPEHPVFQASASTRETLLRLGFRERPLDGNRRTAEPTLRRLEEGLFEDSMPPVEAEGSLRILRASRREDEIEAIARAILRLVREEGVPYREIAVLFHDLSGVSDLLEGTFRRFGIPLRLGRPRPLERHPLFRFLLDLGSTLAGGPRRETLLRLFRSGLIEGLDLGEVDRLDHRIRKEGPPRSAAQWTALGSEPSTRSVGRVLTRLEGAAKSIAGKRTHDALARAWLRCFEDLVVPFGEQGPEGPTECAAYRQFQVLLESAKELHEGGKAPLTLARLVEVVKEGAGCSMLCLQDRRREAVNAIDAYEARQWEVPYLFVAGVLEREFPPAPLEDLFFHDEDRRALTARGLRFPDREWRHREERFLFYTAITRARVRLQISHARSDSQGNPTLPSFFLREVEKLFTPASLKAITSDRSPSAVLPAPEEMVSLADVDRAIFLGLGERNPSPIPSPGARLAAALYEKRREDAEFRARLATVLAGTRAALTDPALLEDLAQRETAFSNRALTSLLQCPYQHFARKWLRLDALPEAQMNPLDLGTILHDTLKHHFESGGKEDPFAVLQANFETIARARAATFRSKSEYWRLRSALARILEAERGRASELRPSLFEVSFGLEREGSRPAVPIQAGGRKERLSGIIDRIDTDPAGKVGYVVDYKYRDEESLRGEFKASAGPEIEKFQMALYLLALRESFGLEPAGAELISLRKDVRRFALGRERLASSWAPPEKATLLSEEDFEAFLSRAGERMSQLIAQARSGDIETRPRDLKLCGPEGCDAADVCRYDRWIGGKGRGE
ncbi:MAG TPA: PD-(D/E)XK nuclease family protein [Candidatus Polarisedimenticolia bacterium]|nr:PD-(D/E)XK nuclease family protein [Candidatus Polarisedimenticolia bacterium]